MTSINEGTVGKSRRRAGLRAVALTALLVSGATTPLSAEALFQGRQFPVGGSDCVVVTDLNADGHQDLVTAGRSSDDVTVLLGNGDGTFGAAVSFHAGNSPSCVAVGDFNADGNPDLVTANRDSDDASILLGNGDGTLSPGASFGVGEWPQSLAVGDFNADGHQDIVVGNRFSRPTVLLGTGDGAFYANLFPQNVRLESLAVGDFNSDGRQDLATTRGSGVVLYEGIGNGLFYLAAILDVGPGATSVVVGDFDADGREDLAVGHERSPGSVTVLRGNGDGTFDAGLSLPSGEWTASVAVGDFNADGFQDLATANQDGVKVLMGHGDGTFGAPELFFFASSLPPSSFLSFLSLFSFFFLLLDYGHISVS